MSINLGSLTIVSGKKDTFDAPPGGIKAVVIGNESGLTVVITMIGGNVQKTLYPSTVDWFAVQQGFMGNILINPSTILNNAATFPASMLIFDAIGPGDSESASMYPISLNRNTNIGNVINTVGGVANSIQNDTNVAGTLIAESTVLGAGSSSVTITNDGIATFTNKVLANLLRTLAGNDLTFDAQGIGHKVALQANSTDIVDVNSSGLQLLAGTLALLAGSVSRVSIFTAHVTAVPTLFNHGLGAVPDIVIPIVNGTAGGTFSCIYDVATLSNTQVKLTGSATFDVTCLAIKS